MSDTSAPEGLDLLYGSEAIANYLGVTRRTVEHLIETKRMPYFKIGRTVAGRRSTLTSWTERLERGAE